jgi:hypothetical protein
MLIFIDAHWITLESVTRIYINCLSDYTVQLVQMLMQFSHHHRRRLFERPLGRRPLPSLPFLPVPPHPSLPLCFVARGSEESDELLQ